MIVFSCVQVLVAITPKVSTYVKYEFSGKQAGTTMPPLPAMEDFPVVLPETVDCLQYCLATFVREELLCEYWCV